MCGIFGAAGWPMSVDEGLAALRTLRHRGPDGEGHVAFADPPAFLGHRRLAIIDLSPAGAQPMANEDGSLHLTFNGEIYNHESLRAELVAKGHAFRSRCDAEVVLHLYEEKGIDLLHDLRGMFAFALYDSGRDEWVLARDRLGIKPLYWHDDGTRFCFASELKAIRAVRGLDLRPDVTAYYDYLTYELVPAPKTVWKDTFKLPAAHWMRRTRAGTEVRRYWSPEPVEQAALGEEEALAQLDALLRRAVEEHLVSDVPVGTFLSAGVDSSLVSIVAGEVSGRALRAFTVGFDGRGDDEADEAAALAASRGMPHVVQRFGERELLQGAELLPELFDEPFADASALPMIELCRLAGSEMKVVLSGDGGDETHLGYGRYRKRGRKQRLYGLARSVPGLSSVGRLGSLPSIPWVRALQEQPLGRPYSFHLGLPREAKRLLLDAGSELDDYDDYWLVREHASSLSSFAGQQRLDLRSHLPDGILTKVDRTAMRFGLEVRPPLLDHRLVELALSLPDPLKVQGGTQKVLLRRLLARHAPAAVAGARKRAFSVPMKKFVAEDGLLRLSGDVDVFGSFRISRRRLERWFRPSRDYAVYWLLHCLETFLRRETA